MYPWPLRPSHSITQYLSVFLTYTVVSVHVTPTWSFTVTADVWLAVPPSAEPESSAISEPLLFDDPPASMPVHTPNTSNGYSLEGSGFEVGPADVTAVLDLPDQPHVSVSYMPLDSVHRSVFFLLWYRPQHICETYLHPWVSVGSVSV
jgi:hypothetical protein